MVDPQFRTTAESLFAQGTFRLGFGVPVAFNAVQAEVVAARCGHRVAVDVQTNAAPELLHKRGAQSSDTCQKQ